MTDTDHAHVDDGTHRSGDIAPWLQLLIMASTTGTVAERSKN
jgi:hypothetical protein